MKRTLLVLASTVLASTAAAQAPASESSSSTDTASADLASTDTAVSAQPQISGLRSGSIGIPSEGAADGLQALLSNQISRKGVDTDAFAKFGGLSFTDKIAFEILGETFTASVPRTLIDGMVVLPRTRSTTISDVGFRFRIRLSSGAPSGLTKRGELVRCLGPHGHAAQSSRAAKGIAALKERTPSIEAQMNAESDAQKKLDAAMVAGDTQEIVVTTTVRDTIRKELQRSLDEERSAQMRLEINKRALSAYASTPCANLFPIDSNLSDRELYARGLLATAAGLTVTFGTRFLRRASPETDGTDSEGVSGELALQHIAANDALGTSVFISGSALQLGYAADKVGTTPALFPRFRELRLTVGAEIRVHAADNVLPRAGFYASVSQARWDNEFAMLGQATHVRGYQGELAMYFSGHFIGGFSGLVSFGVVLPYGDEKTQYIFSLVPSIGAPLGSKGGAK